MKLNLSLFKNEHRKEGSMQPDYRGLWDKDNRRPVSVKLQEGFYTISGWTKKTKDGRDYLSIQLSNEPYNTNVAKSTEPITNDLPF